MCGRFGCFPIKKCVILTKSVYKKLENQIINKRHPTNPLRPRYVYLSPSLCLLHNMFGWAEGLTPRVSWTVTVSPNFSDSLCECDLIITDRKKTSSPFNQTLQDTTGSRECRYLESGCETELRECQLVCSGLNSKHQTALMKHSETLCFTSLSHRWSSSTRSQSAPLIRCVR